MTHVQAFLSFGAEKAGWINVQYQTVIWTLPAKAQLEWVKPGPSNKGKNVWTLEALSPGHIYRFYKIALLGARLSGCQRGSYILLLESYLPWICNRNHTKLVDQTNDCFFATEFQTFWMLFALCRKTSLLQVLCSHIDLIFSNKFFSVVFWIFAFRACHRLSHLLVWLIETT